MAILNLKNSLHFLPFFHFYFSFLAKSPQLEEKARTSSGTFCTCAAALADQSSLRRQQQQQSSPVSC
jgi:hypothetical protein